MRIYAILFLVLLSIFESNAGGKFVKIENCTTTNKSLHIERCDVSNGAANVIIDIFKPIDQMFVSDFNIIIIKNPS